MFAFLGHVAFVKDVAITEVTKSGLTLLFVAFPALLNLLEAANFFSVMFFLMCVTLGIDSVFGFTDYYIKYYEDTFPYLKKKIGKQWEVLIIIIFSFFWSLIFCSQGGIYNFNLFDANCTHIQLLVVFLGEVVLIAWVFGINKMSELIFIRTGDRIPKFYIFILRIFVPAFATMMLIFGWIHEFTQVPQLKKEGYTDAQVWGARFIWLIPLTMCVVAAFFPNKHIKPIDLCIKEQFGIVFEKETDVSYCRWLVKNDAKYTITNQAMFDQI